MFQISLLLLVQEAGVAKHIAYTATKNFENAPITHVHVHTHTHTYTRVSFCEQILKQVHDGKGAACLRRHLPEKSFWQLV